MQKVSAGGRAKNRKNHKQKKGGSRMKDGCPGAKMQDFREKETKGDESGKRQSQLRQWPIQLHLVSPEAPDDEVYQRALNMSRVRDRIGNPDDGVYCPICHKANIDLDKLGTPCPTCSRPLLRFGWD